MKAKTINENISFERGKNPKEVLGIADPMLKEIKKYCRIVVKETSKVLKEMEDEEMEEMEYEDQETYYANQGMLEVAERILDIIAKYGN